MNTSHEFKDFWHSYGQCTSVWVSKASDLLGGSRVIVALLDDCEECVAVFDPKNLAEATTYSQSLLVQHLSQIEYVYEFSGSVDNEAFKYKNLDGTMLESDFSCGKCTSEIAPSSDDLVKYFIFGVEARYRGTTPPANMKISGQIDVHPVRENGPPSINLRFETLFSTPESE